MPVSGTWINNCHQEFTATLDWAAHLMSKSCVTMRLLIIRSQWGSALGLTPPVLHPPPFCPPSQLSLNPLPLLLKLSLNNSATFPVSFSSSHVNIKYIFVRSTGNPFPGLNLFLCFLARFQSWLLKVKKKKKNYEDSHILEYLRRWELVNEEEFKRQLERQKLDICWHSSASVKGKQLFNIVWQHHREIIFINKNKVRDSEQLLAMFMLKSQKVGSTLLQVTALIPFLWDSTCGSLGRRAPLYQT